MAKLFCGMCALVGCFALAGLRVEGATAPPAAAIAPKVHAPAVSLANAYEAYRTVLLDLKRPPYVEYEYTETRSGPSRIITEEHRVYRTSAGQERNDTIMVNGTQLVPATSKILRRDIWPYDVAQFAVTPDEYDVTPTNVTIVGGHKSFAFTVTRKATAGFAIKGLYLDVAHLLPLRETFSVGGGGCVGDGFINFGIAGAYWLPTSIQVTCTAQTAAGPSIFKESIRFSNYRFPNSIPADIFGSGGAASTGQ